MIRGTAQPISARSSVRISIAALLAVCLTGCTVRGPDVAVAEVSEVEPASSATLLRIAIDVHNPTGGELRLREMNYTVTLTDGTRYSGRRATESTLAPDDRIVIELPAVFTHDADGQITVDDVRVRGSLLYLQPSEFFQSLYDADLYRPSVQFAGQIDQ